MKSLFFKTIVAGLIVSPVAYSLSLYDTAPPIGLPESHAIKYNAYIGGGFDDNLNSSHSNKQSGGYVNFSVGASYADYESINKVNYHVNLGGQLYNKKANGAKAQLFSNISGGLSMSRSLGVGRVYSLSANVSYRPEPDYANGISAARAQGDCLNWSLSNAYSQTIDSRWSWTLSASTSGNIYSSSEYKIDNRKYIATSASLNYRYSTQTSYSASTSYRFDFRDYGHNSNNVYVNLSLNHALDPVSSCNVSTGVQLKSIVGKQSWYPNLRAGYNRRMGSGLSVNSYISLDNENVNTYGRQNGRSYNYLSDLTWRVGVNCSYAITPLISCHFGGSLLSTHYSKGEGAGNYNRSTWTLNCGLSYRFRPDTSLNISYNYTNSSSSHGMGYDRNVVSAGLSYTF